MGMQFGGGKKSSNMDLQGTVFNPFFVNSAMRAGFGPLSLGGIAGILGGLQGTGPYGISSTSSSPVGIYADINPVEAGLIAPPRKKGEGGQPLFTVEDIIQYYDSHDPQKKQDIPRILSAGGLGNEFTMDQWDKARRAAKLSGRSGGVAEGARGYAEAQLEMEEQARKQFDATWGAGKKKAGTGPQPPAELSPEMQKKLPGYRWNPQTQQWAEAAPGTAQLITDPKTGQTYVYGQPVAGQRHLDAIMRMGPGAFDTTTGLPPTMDVSALGAQYFKGPFQGMSPTDALQMAQGFTTGFHSGVAPPPASLSAGLAGGGMGGPEAIPALNRPGPSALTGFQTPELRDIPNAPNYEESFVKQFSPFVQKGMEEYMGPGALERTFNSAPMRALSESMYQSLYEPQRFETERVAKQDRGRLMDSLALSGINPSHPVAQAQLAQFDGDVAARLLSESRTASSAATAARVQMSQQEVLDMRNRVFTMADYIERAVENGWTRDLQTYGITADSIAKYNQTMMGMTDIMRQAKQGIDSYNASLFSTEAGFLAQTYAARQQAAVGFAEVGQRAAAAADEYNLGIYREQMGAATSTMNAATNMANTIFGGMIEDIKSQRNLFDSLVRTGEVGLARSDAARATLFDVMTKQLTLMGQVGAFNYHKEEMRENPSFGFKLGEEGAKLLGQLGGSALGTLGSLAPLLLV
jgi:hypothetical protein